MLQSEIEQQRTGTLEVLEEDRQRAHAERQRQFDANLKESEDALAAARKEWEDALAEAANKRAAAETGGPDRVKQAETDLSGLDELIDTTQRKVDVVGTFNPAWKPTVTGRRWQPTWMRFGGHKSWTAKMCVRGLRASSKPRA